MSLILRAFHQAEFEEDNAEFFLVLCHDVFLEVIHWGNRRQLIKLERVGQRFHSNVERFFSKTPFLRLVLLIGARLLVLVLFWCSFCIFICFYSQSGHGIETKITGNHHGGIEYFDCSHILPTDLETFPPFPFLRFKEIDLISSWRDDDDDTQSIDAKCQLLEDQLKLIKPEILNDSKLCFYGNVDAANSSRFSDHSELLSYINYRLLPICGVKQCGFGFDIGLYSEGNVGRCIISSLLQMPKITCCSDALIRIYNADQMKLPVKEISNWLHRKCGGQRDRSLFIYFCIIENMLEMLIHLKTVIFFPTFFIRKSPK